VKLDSKQRSLSERATFSKAAKNMPRLPLEKRFHAFN